MPRVPEIVTQPAIEPVTLAEVKAHLRIDIPDEDTTIAALTVAARQYCEAYISRSFITTVWDQFIDVFPSGGGYYNRAIRAAGPDPSNPNWLPTASWPLVLARSPLQSVQSVTYLDMGGQSQTMDMSAVRVLPGSPGSIQPVYGHIWPLVLPVNSAVAIRFTAGFGDTADKVPEVLKSAIKLMAAHLYENREAVGVNAQGSELPLGVAALLNTFDHGWTYG